MCAELFSSQQPSKISNIQALPLLYQKHVLEATEKKLQLTVVQHTGHDL